MVLTSSQQLFYSLDEALVEAAGESWPRVVAQDAYQHDGIVLYRGFRGIVAAEEALDLLRSGRGGGGRGFGGFDDHWEVEDLFVAVCVRGCFAEQTDATRSICFRRIDRRRGRGEEVVRVAA